MILDQQACMFEMLYRIDHCRICCRPPKAGMQTNRSVSTSSCVIETHLRNTHGDMYNVFDKTVRAPTRMTLICGGMLLSCSIASALRHRSSPQAASDRSSQGIQGGGISECGVPKVFEAN